MLLSIGLLIITLLSTSLYAQKVEKSEQLMKDIAYYKAYADEGDAEAQFKLSRLYNALRENAFSENGKELLSDELEELENHYLLQAASQGLAKAEYSCVVNSLLGEELEKKYLENAAHKGLIEAQNHLGCRYLEEGNFEKAEYYFKQALGNMSLIAIRNLATLYALQGKEKEVDQWLKREQELEEYLKDAGLNLAPRHDFTCMRHEPKGIKFSSNNRLIQGAFQYPSEYFSIK